MPADQEHLEAALPQVRAAFPEQDLEHPTFRIVQGTQEEVFLAKKGGFCVFFKPGTGCTIHSSQGAEAKPLVCQLFPVQLVKTDDGLRLGTRPTCLSDAKVWSDGPLVPGAFLNRILDTEGSSVPRPEVLGEAMVLRLLRLPDLDTNMLLSFLAEHETPDRPPPVDHWLSERLDGLLAAADSIIGGEFPVDAQGPLHPATATAECFAAFRKWSSEHDEPGVERWPEVPEDFLPYLRNALRRQVFLRQTKHYPSLPWALIGYVAAARWAAAYAVSTASDGGGETDEARFGRLWSTLLVVLESPRMQQTFLEAGPPFD